MITVHHLNNSRSQRILWMLEELEAPYDIVPHLRDPQTNLAPPSLRALHPLGKLPVIVDGDLTLAESGAIVDYILDRYGAGRLAPARGTPEYLRYTYWMHYAEGSAMQPLVLKVVFDQIEAARMPFFARPIARAIAGGMKRRFIQPELDRHLDFLEAELGDSPWFAGADLTAADIMLSFPLQAAVARCGLDARRPKLIDFVARVEARPAFRRSVERGGPYKL